VFFFGLIVTVTDRRRVEASGIERACLECVDTTPHRLVEVYRQLAIFFIPVWRWDRRHLLACERCGMVEQVSAEEAEGLRRQGG
jgi:hypothetical protein